MIKNFTIFGERCSGTNFLKEAIIENFNLNFTNKYCWKHFFGHCKLEYIKDDDTLFLGIIRDPIEWIDSIYKKMHHIPLKNRLNIKSFLFNEFYSVYEDSQTEIMEDRNFLTNERYKNIFQLRYIKNNYLTTNMPILVKNYLLIRYEDLRDKYDIVLTFLEKKFNLKRKFTIFKRIESYKGYNKQVFIKKNVSLDDKTIKIIENNINKEQENSIGYILNIK
jgi:hypothetical protein